MLITIMLLIFSFLFEGFISNYLSSSLGNFNLFSTLYTLICLIVVFPYFYNEKKYYILLIIFGALIDIVYTNTFMLNIVLFIIISIIIKIINLILPENILMVNIMSICAVMLYYILSYLVLTIINYNTYPLALLFELCLNSLAMTIIYTSILYCTIEFLFSKFDIKQIK